MATNYIKKLKTIAVYQLLDGSSRTIEDTATDDMATRALNEFKNYEDMHYEITTEGVTSKGTIPYHSVQYIEVTEQSTEVEGKDPYGCDPTGE